MIPSFRSRVLLAAIAGAAAGGWLELDLPARARADAPEVVVGSKNFTEGVVLGELARLLAEDAGAGARHRRALGGTRLVFEALVAGDIDAYAEYTGTLAREVLVDEAPGNRAALVEGLAARGLVMSGSLGFRDNFALGMRRAEAERLRVRTISDLRDHPELVFRFGLEFMDRDDGWPGLDARYRLPQQDVEGVEHEIAYRGLAGGDADVTDLYTTDAEIAYYDLVALEDDLAYFPEYAAVLLYREDLEARAPEVVRSLRRLEGAIDEAAMIAMNAAVKIDGEPESRVAADFLASELGVDADGEPESRLDRFLRTTGDHVALVAVSLAAAILFAIPVGLFAAYRPRVGQIVLAVVGVGQTLPSLALLVFMVPIFGIGAGPALVALFVYSLLPIVRNTHAGVTGIPKPLRESALALGLPFGARLRRVELPLATPSILAGVKTAAVIDVGAATLGALVGAGGYGQPILTGIRLDDTGLILEGAVPAALLALLIQGMFELAERRLVPRGLR